MVSGSKVIFISSDKLTAQIRSRILLFIIGLIVSGVTAFPIESELSLAHRWIRNLELNHNCFLTPNKFRSYGRKQISFIFGRKLGECLIG